jgi:phosphoglucosamine mutase
VITYGDQPDGKNINKDCGSMHPAFLCQKIWEHRADVGIAHDGDADRVLLCDERGRLIDGRRHYGHRRVGPAWPKGRWAKGHW